MHAAVSVGAPFAFDVGVDSGHVEGAGRHDVFVKGKNSLPRGRHFEGKDSEHRHCLCSFGLVWKGLFLQRGQLGTI